MPSKLIWDDTFEYYHIKILASKKSEIFAKAFRLLDL